MSKVQSHLCDCHWCFSRKSYYVGWICDHNGRSIEPWAIQISKSGQPKDQSIFTRWILTVKERGESDGGNTGEGIFLASYKKNHIDSRVGNNINFFMLDFPILHDTNSKLFTKEHFTVLGWCNNVPSCLLPEYLLREYNDSLTIPILFN